VSLAGLVAPLMPLAIGERSGKCVARRGTICVDRALGVLADAPFEAHAFGMVLSAGPPHATQGWRQIFMHAGRNWGQDIINIGFSPIKLDAKMCAACAAPYTGILSHS
jgi:hypothetical protein